MNKASDPFGDMTEVKRKQIKFGKVGDWFRGVITDNSIQRENRLSSKHEMQTVYEMMAMGGSFHDIVDKVVQEDPTEIIPGDFYSYYAKGVVQSQMKNFKVGQIVGLRFTEERKSDRPGFNSTKIIKIFDGGMDPEYQGERLGDLK